MRRKTVKLTYILLPAHLIVAPVVHELTAVSEAAHPSLLVVLADIGLVVPADGGADVGGSSDGALGGQSLALD